MHPGWSSCYRHIFNDLDEDGHITESVQAMMTEVTGEMFSIVAAKS